MSIDLSLLVITKDYMSAFWSIAKRKNDTNGNNTSLIIEEFKKRMLEWENLIYGLALFFEAINLLHEGNPIVETYKKQFRNIIRNGREVLDKAAKLLADANNGTVNSHELSAYDFNFFNSCPNPDEFKKRAEIFYESYVKVFPNRPRDKELSKEETFQILEEAIKQIGPEGIIR